MSVDEDRVRAIIAESIAEGGPILAAIKQQISNSVSDSGEVHKAIQGQVLSAVAQVKEEMDKDAIADGDFPFRKF